MRRVVLGLLLLLSACDIGCIYPGDGVNANFTNVIVPAYLEGMDPSKPSTLWVDSGIKIGEGEEVPFGVIGDIDLCGKLFNRKEFEMCPEWNCQVIEVSNRFCANGAPGGIHNPSNLLDIKNKEPLCEQSSTTSQRYYVDTYLEVSPGDKVLFELVPVVSVDLVDCDNIPLGFSWYNDEDFKDVKGKKIQLVSGDDVDPGTICKAGGQVLIHRGAYELQIFLPPSFKGELLNASLVGNGYTPRSNRVIVGNSNAKWIEAAAVDMRVIVPHILSDKDFCDVGFKSQVDPEEIRGGKKVNWEYKYKDSCTSQKDRAKLKRFETYKVNKMCGNFVSDGTYKDGIYSIRYDDDFDALNPCFRARRRNESDLEKAWADLLVAKIGKAAVKDKSSLLQSEDEAQLCIYNIGTKETSLYSGRVKQCMNIDEYGGAIPSLELNTWFTIPRSISGGSPLLLGIAGKESSSKNDIYSGYRVRVRKSCSYQNGERLYVYIGDGPPSIAPGDPSPNAHELRFSIDAPKRAVVNPQNIDPSTYSLSFNGSGKVYFGIAGAIDSSLVKAVKTGKYLPSEDNKYTVSIVQERWYPNFSGPFNTIYHAIVKLFYGKGEKNPYGKPEATGVIVQIYNAIVGRIAPAVQALIVLYLVTYGLSFLLGIIRDPRSDVILRVTKIAFILLLVSDYSWKFFGETIFDLFVNSSNELIYYFTGSLSGKYSPDSTFEFLDRTVGVIITNQFWLRMLALFLSGPAGWFIMSIILWGIFLFFSCIIEAMVIYLMILIATGLLFLLAPVFIAFLIFQRTKPLFEGWLKMLISFALRPIFIFGTLALLNAVMMATLYEVNNFGVCPSCIVSTDIFGSDLCIISSLVPIGFDAGMGGMDRFLIPGTAKSGFLGLPVSLVSVVVFLLVAHSMKSFLKITDSMVDMITGTMMGYTGVTGGGSPSDAGHAAYQAMLSVAGLDDATQSEIGQAIRANPRSRRSITLEVAEDAKKVPSSKDDPLKKAERIPLDGSSKDSNMKSVSSNNEGSSNVPIKGDGVQADTRGSHGVDGLAGAPGEGTYSLAGAPGGESGEGSVANPIYQGGPSDGEHIHAERGGVRPQDPYSLASGEGTYSLAGAPGGESGEGSVANPIYQGGPSDEEDIYAEIDDVRPQGPYSLASGEGTYSLAGAPGGESGEGSVANPIYQGGPSDEEDIYAEIDDVRPQDPYSLAGAPGGETRGDSSQGLSTGESKNSHEEADESGDGIHTQGQVGDDEKD
ncbi:type IV secretion system protein [Neorickettsia sp. 179522]|uniref:type IV secretion system protein n=1 Tax=Neorickettsia sp. 179522 TaxID=1714371 RepID=UPI0007957322|nr:type IV secretion system protein [Neorickettsia sp. 179522]KYH12793.1 type VI secretion protein [Neorickettsia sp. 179522]